MRSRWPTVTLINKDPAESAPGHSRRFVRVRATSGYPPKLTVKAGGKDRPPRANNGSSPKHKDHEARRSFLPHRR